MINEIAMAALKNALKQAVRNSEPMTNINAKVIGVEYMENDLYEIKVRTGVANYLNFWFRTNEEGRIVKASLELFGKTNQLDIDVGPSLQLLTPEGILQIASRLTDFMALSSMELFNIHTYHWEKGVTQVHNLHRQNLLDFIKQFGLDPNADYNQQCVELAGKFAEHLRTVGEGLKEEIKRLEQKSTKSRNANMTYEESGITAISKTKFDEMVNYILTEGPDAFLLELMQTPEDRVAGIFHMTTGRHLRTVFGLWDLKPTPKIEKGVDVSPNHPDNISCVVILAARRALLNKAETLKL